jgi:serine/threonine-protein kinase
MYEAGDIIALTGGAWRLRAPLAASSYGVLWRAASCATGEAAALKLVNLEQMALALPPLRARWTACAAGEIAFLRALQPWDRRHIVRLLDSGEHLGQPALALELLDGDLARHLAFLRARAEAPSLDQVLDWIGQVNAALARVHQYGWRYLDLKPANLLVDRSGSAAGGTITLKLADFGTNRALAEQDAHSYTGTASWQAPEQFFALDAGGYRTDARADYFALGALFYHLVTGALLRFSCACAEARREHGTAGAAHPGQRGRLPAVLEADEAALFARQLLPHGPAVRAAALALLRSLVAERPEQRPRHALEISRLLGAIREAIAADAVQADPLPVRSAA